MRILLAEPPKFGGFRVDNHPNLGILYLSAYIKQQLKRREPVDVLYLNQLMKLKTHLQRVREFQPDIYGLSFASMICGDAYETIRAVRNEFPGLPIISGGPHPTAMPQEVLEEAPTDLCVIGEGEETFREVVEHYRFGERKLEEIAGIAYRSKGEFRKNPLRPLIADLDQLPLADWDMVDFHGYKGNYQFQAKPSTAIVANRGCVLNCTFCSNPIWKQMKPWVRARSPENICREIQLLHDKGVREIYIRSDDFNYSKRWSIEVCRAIRNLGLDDMMFQCNLRGNQVTEEFAKAFSEMNGWLVYLGVESGNQHVLNGIGKRVTLEQITDACTLLKKYGVKIFGLFMIYNMWEENGEFRYEGPEDVDGTIRFIKGLRKRKLIDYISFSTTTPLPGSDLYEIAERHGFLRKGYVPADMSEFRIALPGVSEALMRRSRLKGMLLQLYFVLRSGGTLWLDAGKLRTKVRYLLRSIRF